MCCDFGAPRIVRCYNGTEFRNAIVATLFEAFGVAVAHGAVRHPQSQGAAERFKGELNPEMKLCELSVLGHCIHLPLILFACASSGQSYNAGSPVPPNFCDVIDTAMTGDPIAF